MSEHTAKLTDVQRDALLDIGSASEEGEAFTAAEFDRSRDGGRDISARAPAVRLHLRATRTRLLCDSPLRDGDRTSSIGRIAACRLFQLRSNDGAHGDLSRLGRLGRRSAMTPRWSLGEDDRCTFRSSPACGGGRCGFEAGHEGEHQTRCFHCRLTGRDGLEVDFYAVSPEAAHAIIVRLLDPNHDGPQRVDMIGWVTS